MTSAIVLGNGRSRLEIDLDVCKAKAKIYGCNAIYREFVPDVLIATDNPIATAIQETGYATSNCFYTRDPIAKKGACPIPSKWKGWSSGPIAAALACADGHQQIFLVGFDLGGLEGKFNNIYADTEFYKKSQDKETYSGNWVHQFIKLSREYPTKSFIRIMGKTTSLIHQLETLDNFNHRSIEWFKDLLNNNGEL